MFMGQQWGFDTGSGTDYWKVQKFPGQSALAGLLSSSSHMDPIAHNSFLRNTKCDVYTRKQVYATGRVLSVTTCSKGFFSA